MPIARLHRFLTTPTAKASKSQKVFWLSLSLTFSVIYALAALQGALGSEYVVQDDARQHVFWMRRFLDSQLFPGDLIADYFQSVAPWGYATFYRLFAIAGIDPMGLSKVLPLVLGLFATCYCFGICLEILPVPVAGFMASLLLNQNLWMRDDLVSATPAAFVYPLFLGFLYYLLRRSLLPCLVAIALLGLFYPQCVFIAAGLLILQLGRWEQGRFQFSSVQRDYWFCGLGLGMVLLVLLPYALEPSEFGSVITVAQARALPAFSSEGWSNFFNDDPWNYWVCGKRSGMLPTEWCRLMAKYSILLLPPQVWVSFSLPFLLRNTSRFPLVKQVTGSVFLLPQMLFVSGGMFFAAHLLLFKLHLPNRYTEHSLRILVALAAGVALTILLDALLQVAQNKGKPLLAIGFTGVLGAVLILYPSVLQANDYPFPTTQYTVGTVPELYEFLQKQPKDTLIASLVEEANSLPTFAQRSLLVGGEGYALPYHLGYYNQIYQRTVDLIEAQYSPDWATVQNFIQRYGVDLWLLEQGAFTPEYVNNNRWIREYESAATDARLSLERGRVPVLVEGMEKCAVFETKGLVVLQAECLFVFHSNTIPVELPTKSKKLQ
ncbi:MULTISPECIES: hypothetical protein [unclassified Coleofasciculus]|uniref:hypothetical protein n=1 Tax=unclassified Coleofasciculus TaxID=2692782 RepID=UPI001881D17C|nr:MULTISPECIES: hypothetical protein [unclassified Coleofasciculus]MBE9129698.1 hypothetical protein [Coleofasciculus sp. LEGE 07081]MBE9149547.1 hypothetical protein [Coleofasciculus sp. LEGE 07092]